MKRERKNHGMAIKLSPAGEFCHVRGKLLLFSGGAALSPPRKSLPKNKSRDKGKGSNKAKALDIRLNPHLDSWKIMGSSEKGVSCREFEEEEEKEETMEVREEREREEEGVFGGEREYGDDDVMDFYEVWGMWEYVDEEDWCVVGEEM